MTPTFNNKTVDRKLVFWEHQANRALRMGNWKLVAKTKSPKKFTKADENAWELYNLEQDPSEMVNLVTKYPEKVKEMSEIWKKEALRTKALPWPWDKE